MIVTIGDVVTRYEARGIYGQGTQVPQLVSYASNFFQLDFPEDGVGKVVPASGIFHRAKQDATANCAESGSF